MGVGEVMYSTRVVAKIDAVAASAATPVSTPQVQGHFWESLSKRVFYSRPIFCFDRDFYNEFKSTVT